VRVVAHVVTVRQGTANPLVGKLKSFAGQGETMDKPLDVTFEDIQTIKGMVADEASVERKRGSGCTPTRGKPRQQQPLKVEVDAAVTYSSAAACELAGCFRSARPNGPKSTDRIGRLIRRDFVTRD
jgi:hypothetical protein